MKPQSSLAFDREPGTARSAFLRMIGVERDYGRRLRGVARHIGEVLSGFDLAQRLGIVAARGVLERYAATLSPWARSVGQKMVLEVSRRDERAWFRRADTMSPGLKDALRFAPITDTIEQRTAEQVALITSLPTVAAQRVARVAEEGAARGLSVDQIVQDILRTAEVTRTRANTIACTEVNRTATALTQRRAVHVGSPGYLWITMRDERVRRSHEGMQGHFVRWDAPPTLDGFTGHAGTPPNCRCVCEPILPE